MTYEIDRELDRMRGAGYPTLADALKESLMTSTGVIPIRIPAYCGAKDDDTGRLCDLDHGHDGPHQSIITITWLDQDSAP